MYGMCVQLGFAEWRPKLVWKINSTIKRIDGVEWPRASPVPYQLQLQYTCSLAAPCTATDTAVTLNCYGAAPWSATPFPATIQNEKVTVTDISAYPVCKVQRDPAKAVAHAVGSFVIGPKFTSWAEAAARTVAMYPAEIPFMPGDPRGMNELYNTTSGSVAYVSYARAALAIAVRNGVTEAAAAFAWIDGQFTQHVRSAWQPGWRWQIT